MIADHLSVDMSRIETEILPEMDTKTHRVEKRAGAENARLNSRTCGGFTCDIGERIGRIRHNQQHCLGRRAHYWRNYFAVDRGVLVEEPQSSLRVATVGRAAGLFID